MEKIGDTHNFGKFVKPVGKNWLLKPRSTFWEELFLSRDSKFRDLLDDVLRDEPLIECLPRIEFKRWKKNPNFTLVEKLKVKKIKKGDFDAEYLLEALGGLLAISAWFGIEDLHNDNIFLGKDARNGKLTLVPLDIEFVFNNIELPTVTGILPPGGADQSKIAGARPMVQIIKKVAPRESVAAVYGYISTTQKLIANSTRILKMFESIKGFRDAPLRCVVRHTQDYMVHMGKSKTDFLFKTTPLIPDELVQMNRGDIPYFFSTLNDRRIRYFSSKDLKKAQVVEDQGWCAEMARSTIDSSQIFDIPQRTELLKDFGPIILAGYFLPKKFNGEIWYRGMSVKASTRNIRIKFKDVAELQGDRNWSSMKIVGDF